MSEITTEEHQLEMIRELGRVCENQEDTIHILRRQIAELEHGEKMWRGNANSVRRVCKDAGIPTHHGGHYEGVPRDLADPVKDIVSERNRMRGALRLIADTEDLTFLSVRKLNGIISTAKAALSKQAGGEGA